MIPIRITYSGPPVWCGNEYGSVCSFNCDNTRILLIKVDKFVVMDGAGNYLFATAVDASAEPRWSRTEPHIFYAIRGNQLWRHDISRSDAAVIHTFSEYAAISGKGEGDLSEDGNHLALCGDGHDVFRYEISTDTKGPVFNSPPFDGLKISPDNHILLSKSDGIFVVDWGMKQLTTTNGHAAVCRGANGSEVLIYTSNLDNGIYAVLIADPSQRTLLCKLDWSLAVDISACNSGFCLVSTYGANAVGPYANQILKVPLDGSGVSILCPTFSNAVSYTAQPKASLSHDGSRFVFSSNGGNVTVPDWCDTWLGILDPPIASLTEMDYAALEGRKWRQEVELEVRNGKMVVTSFREFDRT